VGYTNAGKSTLLNALTDAGVLQANMLFATLDSTTRRLGLPEGREATLTDTVGFIHKLPHGLVEAFKSTLDEVRGADLLLHIADAGAPQRDAQMQAVREVLEEIGASNTPNVVVYNKIDTVPEQELAGLMKRQTAAVFVSGLNGDGLETLRSRIAEEASRGGATMAVLIPYTRGDLIALAHERAQIVTERHHEDGTRLIIKVPQGLTSVFTPFVTDHSSDD
jgi:GTP-binding protein HflX